MYVLIFSSFRHINFVWMDWGPVGLVWPQSCEWIFLKPGLYQCVSPVIYVSYFILGPRLGNRRTGQTQSHENALQRRLLWVHKLLYQKEYVKFKHPVFFEDRS